MCDMKGFVSSKLEHQERGLTDLHKEVNRQLLYRGAGKSLARPISRWILFDGENISFDASFFNIHINTCSTNIPPIMIIRGLEL